MAEEPKDQPKPESEPAADTPEARLAACEKLRDEYLEGWKRAKADLANYKKEEADRLASFAKFANEALVLDLLRVLDSFEVGLATVPAGDPTRKGMELVASQLDEVLKQYGLEQVRASPGDAFDPSRHEAVGEIASREPQGAIAEEVGRGYALHGKIVRPVRVKVAKGSGDGR